MERRGRPKKVAHALDNVERFHIDYIDDEGVIARWFYDRKRNLHGPIAVEAIYPKGHELYEGQDAPIGKNEKLAKGAKGTKASAKSAKAGKNLPKSAMKYLNPANGKMVGYTRAKMLGLV